MSIHRLVVVAITAVLTMSAAPVLIKSTSANEITIGIVRLVIAVLAFAPFVLSRGALSRLAGRQWRQLAVIGTVFGLHWLTFFASIKLATAAIAALAILTYSVQYLVLAWIFNRERITWHEWLAIAACFGGCLMVAPAISLSNDITLGVAVGLLSALLYAALPLLHQRAADIGTAERTFGQFFFALVFFLPFWGYSDWELRQADIYQLFVLGLLCTVVSHGLWVKASTELPAIYSSMIYFLYLPGAVVGSMVFLGEDMDARKLSGCAIVLASSALLSWYRFRHSR